MRKPTNMSLCFTRKWSGVQVPHHPPVFKALLDNGRRTDIGQVLKKPGINRAVIWVWALESYIFSFVYLGNKASISRFRKR